MHDQQLLAERQPRQRRRRFGEDLRVLEPAITVVVREDADAAAAGLAFGGAVGVVAVFHDPHPAVGVEGDLDRGHHVRLSRNEHAKQLFLDYVCQPVRDANGDVMGILLYATDVTAHVQGRLELEETADLEAVVGSYLDMRLAKAVKERESQKERDREREREREKEREREAEEE